MDKNTNQTVKPEVILGVSDYTLDNFVAQGMSKITRLGIEPLAGEFPDADGWLVEFVMLRMFDIRLPTDKAALTFAILRRAHGALQEWELAATASLEDMRSIGAYFRVLRHVENCISATWQALEFARRATEINLFTKDDGTVYQRLNSVYNVSRHFNPEALPEGDLHRTWLSDEAIHTREHAVKFAELRETVSSLARMSEKLVKKRAPYRDAAERD